MNESTIRTDGRGRMRYTPEQNNPLSPPWIPPISVLHGLSAKSKFLAANFPALFLLVSFCFQMVVLGHPPRHHTGERNEDPKEKVATVGGRVVTVKKLGTPPLPAEKTSAPAEIIGQEKSSHFLEVRVYRTSDGRSLAEWTEGHGAARRQFQAWSDLDWMKHIPLKSFSDESSEFFVIIHPIQVSPEDLRRAGKPDDPGTGDEEVKETFQSVGPHRLSSTGAHFLRLVDADSEGMMKKEVPPQIADGLETEISGREKKPVTLTYWKTPR